LANNRCSLLDCNIQSNQTLDIVPRVNCRLPGGANNDNDIIEVEDDLGSSDMLSVEEEVTEEEEEVVDEISELPDDSSRLAGTNDNSNDDIDERLRRKVSELDREHELQLQERSDEELAFQFREKKIHLLDVIRAFKVKQSQDNKKLPRDELIDRFLKERKDGFPLLRWNLMTRAEKEANRRAKRSRNKKKEENAKQAKGMARLRADKKAMNVHKWPVLDTLLGDTPGKDYKVEFHTEDVTAALFLLYLETGGWMYRESMWLIAYIHVIRRLEDEDDIRRLSNLLELCVEQHLSLQKVPYQAVLDDNDLKQVCKWKGQTEERQLMDKKEAVLEWFATSNDPISLDDRKVKICAPEEVDTEERNKLIESLVGLHLKVPEYWWPGYHGKKEWTCVIDSINLEDDEKRYFNLKCLGDPYPDKRYEMAYVDVKKYADREHPEFSDFYLPKTLDESRIDLKFKDRCEKTLQELRKLDRGKALLIQCVF